MKLHNGHMLQSGKYKIERELGHGGFGITYLATQTGLNRDVAIKEFFMSEYCERNAENSQVSVGSSGSREIVDKFRQKFIKEAQTIAALHHPNIIAIHDIFEENGTAYYVMEYHRNGSLADSVKNSGKLPEATAISYIRQVADALSYLHEHKMNHLDVKPGNILLNEKNNAVLIDFGLTKHYDASGMQTSTTPVGISHGYAPLEQYKRGGVSTFSPETDIYSLGATLYKLVTGTTPPEANDIYEDGLPPLPTDLSAPVQNALKAAMQPRRKERPQSIDEFLNMLGGEGEISPIVENESTPEITVFDVPIEATVVGEQVEPKVTPAQSVAGKPEKPQPTSCPAPKKPIAQKEEPATSPLKKILLPIVIVAAALLTFLLWPKGSGEPAPVPAPVSIEYSDSAPAPNIVQTPVKNKPVAQTPTPVKEEVPALTQLYVTTSPAGATIYVDGKKAGASPIEGKEYAQGNHTIKITLDGYKAISTKVKFGEKAVILNKTLTKVEEIPAQQQNTLQTPTNQENVTQVHEEETVFEVVEEEAEFPGGKQALMKYLGNNVKYPQISQENGSQGRVFVNFVIEADGSITNVKVIRSSGDVNLDKEAVRVVSGMPKWKPAKQHDRNVRAKFTLPVAFVLK